MTIKQMLLNSTFSLAAVVQPSFWTFATIAFVAVTMNVKDWVLAWRVPSKNIQATIGKDGR